MTFTFKLAARLARLWSAMFFLLLPVLTIGCVQENGGTNGPAPTDSTVIAISIDPELILIDTADAVSFEAFGRLVAGDSVPVAVIWSASGGTITSAGLFHADSPGLYAIVAQFEAGSLIDSAWVSVTASAPGTMLASVVVTPSTAAVDTGETAIFAAYALDTAGDSFAVAVTWTASGGTISPAGAFQSPSAGSYLVIGRAPGGKSDTALVTVNSATPPPPPPPTLARVVVTPSAAAIDTGETAIFAAYGVNTAGDSVAVAVSWTASGGSITSAGAFRSSSAGNYRVIGQGPGGLSDTALVTVSAPTTPPPPNGLVNECSTPGAGWIFCDDFDQDRLSDYFEYDAKNGSFVRASGLGNGGSWAMKAHFAAGQVDAGALHLAFGKTPQTYFRPVDAGTANYREVYWRFYMKYQTGWTGGGGAKVTRAFGFASSTSWAQSMFGHVWSGGPNSNHLVLDPASGTDVAGNLVTTTYNDFANMRWLGIDQSSTPIFDAAHVGSWHCIEAHVKLNAAGQSDGVFDLWIDGHPEASRTGLNWVGNYNAYGINAVYLENFWNNGSPVAQERYFDNLVVSTQRIGC